MNAAFRRRLCGGERLLGTLITLKSPEIVEIMGMTGFDWLFLDGEHSPLESESLQLLVQAAGPNLACLIRPPSAGEFHIKKALDSGAAGIIVPMVNTPEEAESVVRYAKFSPRGARGVGLGRAQGYGMKFKEYVAAADESLSVVVQAEHIRAVENMDKIVRVSGIDAVFIGPYDLSASMGRMGDVGHPEVVAAIERVTGICRGAGVPLGIFGISAEAVRPYMEKGFTLIAAGADTMLIGEAAGGLMKRLQETPASVTR